MKSKAELFQKLDELSPWAIALGRELFACPELGFKERRTAEIICRELEAMGVKYESGVAETGIIARLTGGEYNIAAVADMDALPRRDGAGCIHSCGHNAQVAAALAAMRALKWAGVGGVTFFFTPAEEYIDLEYRDGLIAAGRLSCRSGKQEMIVRGCFDEMDCALSLHASGGSGVRFDLGVTLAGFVAKRADIVGRTAHTGASPHAGINALQGASLALTALSYLKDRFPHDANIKLYPALTSCGGSVSAITDRATLQSYLRADDMEALFEASGLVDECIRHCAAALGLEAEVTTSPGYPPLLPSRELCAAAKANMLLLCGEEDIQLGGRSGASGDIGDLAAIMPAMQFGFTGVSGSFHGDDFAIDSEERCYVAPAKVLAGTAFDLATLPILRPARVNVPARRADHQRLWLKKRPSASTKLSP